MQDIVVFSIINTEKETKQVFHNSIDYHHENKKYIDGVTPTVGNWMQQR